MAADVEDPRVHGPALVRGGTAHRLARRLGLEPPTPRRRLVKVGLLILVTWVPLVVLSLLHAGQVAIPLHYDPVVFSRFLFVVPLLELAQVAVGASLGVQMQQFLESGLVSERDRPAFAFARDAAIRLRNSATAEAACAVLAVGMSIASRVIAGVTIHDSSWERIDTTMTAAGWWYTLVSLPILYFLLLSWIWVLLLWAVFLFRVSRLDLELTPTHPDRVGGLGFLGWGLASFAPVLLAISAVLSGSLAGEILFRGSSLDALKYHLIVFVVLAMTIVHAPLVVFTQRLARCRFQALLEFGTLIGRHDREFDDKWIKPQRTDVASLLGSPDVSSLADIGAVYEHVQRMRLLPFDRNALLVLILSVVVPMIPLVGTAIPLQEILSKLGGFLA